MEPPTISGRFTRRKHQFGELGLTERQALQVAVVEVEQVEAVLDIGAIAAAASASCSAEKLGTPFTSMTTRRRALL